MRVAGLDEVGRGPLAGPVIAAAVVLREPAVEGLADSKCLSVARRDQLYDLLLQSAEIGIGAASVREVDRLNVLEATMLAMCRALGRLRLVPDLALIDGRQAPRLPCRVRTIVGGDREIPEISAASIVAKVTRDRLMQRLAARYPGYGWETNVGYGTLRHREALRRIGACRHHRRSFRPVRETFPLPLLGETSDRDPGPVARPLLVADL
jgi:ribonuclease HII